MPDPIDAFFELTPNGSPDGKMRNSVKGETADAKKRRGGPTPAAMEITQFTFSNSKALAAMKQQEDLQELMESRSKASGEDASEFNIPPIGKGGSQRSGKLEDDYRFQVRKQIDVASPLLMQAYFSNSHSGIRPEYNDFKLAKITFRKTDSTGPKTYLTMIFGGVYVVGYRLETEGKEPPGETVEFCFQTCEMIYRPQAKTGTLGTKNIKGWDFQNQQEYASGGGSDDAAA
jgi:type VI protein secretion system component Hcp